jgi:hypothetical protein
MDGQLLFKVISGGREYSIYTNGSVSGFGDGAMIVNYFDLLVARECQLRKHLQPTGSQTHETAVHKERQNASQ